MGSNGNGLNAVTEADDWQKRKADKVMTRPKFYQECIPKILWVGIVLVHDGFCLWFRLRFIGMSRDRSIYKRGPQWGWLK